MSMKLKGFPDEDGYTPWEKGVMLMIETGTDNEFDTAFTEDLFIQGICLRTNDGPTVGDYVGLEVVDVDNLLGYGEDFVLSVMGETKHIQPNMKCERMFQGLKDIPAGIYLRVKYHSVGSGDPFPIFVDFIMRRCP